MYNSILHFIENDIKKIEKVLAGILTGEKDADDLSQEVTSTLNNLACNWIGEMYEKLDEEIRTSVERKKKWNIEKRNEPKEILDIAGTIRFNRTGYVDKKTGKYIYLLDRILGIDSHQRLTLGAAANILEEAVLTSYAKGGKAASPKDAASKQTVLELLHKTEIEIPEVERKDKKKFRTLHIVADEDHVSAQFWNIKGDLGVDEKGNKINTIIPKVIVVYEDVINESGENSKKPRYKLVGKRTFCGVYRGETANNKLWEKVRDYIVKNYDTDVLERVYIAGDGGGWIKAGIDIIENSRFVLDRFHMMKYVNKSVAQLENKEDYKSEIWECINTADKEGLKGIYKEILAKTDNENKCEDIKGSLRYFINNWSGIQIQVDEAGDCWKCCAEGQVSHILSARMSSRPMGWSEWGCHQMSKLRAYNKNGGKVIDLLKYQKNKKKKQQQLKEQEDLIKELRKKQSGWEYAEKTNAAIPGISKHSMKWLRNMIWDGFGA